VWDGRIFRVHRMRDREGVGRYWLGALLSGTVAGAIFLRLWRRSADEAPTAPLLEHQLHSSGGTGDVAVRHLGDGVFELVGRVDDRETALRLERIVEETAGVAGVVNRLWIA
jgi:hypothetical protein